jgi:hypothetical protein
MSAFYPNAQRYVNLPAVQGVAKLAVSDFSANSII